MYNFNKNIGFWQIQKFQISNTKLKGLEFRIIWFENWNLNIGAYLEFVFLGLGIFLFFGKSFQGIIDE